MHFYLKYYKQKNKNNYGNQSMSKIGLAAK